MTARHKIDALPFVNPRAHYENIFKDGLRTLWQRKWLILTLLIVGLGIQSAVLLYTETRYTGEATIQVTFVREESDKRSRDKEPVHRFARSHLNRR